MEFFRIFFLRCGSLNVATGPEKKELWSDVPTLNGVSKTVIYYAQNQVQKRHGTNDPGRGKMWLGLCTHVIPHMKMGGTLY